MAELLQTAQAIRELRSAQGRAFGMHYNEDVSIGTTGMIVGEMPFDPNRHDPSSINPMSFNEMVMGVPHVQMEIPRRPIEYNVVLHRDPEERDLPDYLQPVREYKDNLASGVALAVHEAKQRSDKVNIYVVGDTDLLPSDHWDTEVIEGTEAGVDAARAVEEICMRGLTFVISDFNRLPLENKSAALTKSIAIKANHAIELALPANRGYLAVEGANGVKTWKSKDLARANTGLDEHHAGIRGHLGTIGMEVVQIACDNELDAQQNIVQADAQIANSVRALC
jgi:hypothetical protein